MSECRICFNTIKDSLVSPCRCSGSIKHIHQVCLAKWLKEKYPKEFCELLKNPRTGNSKLQCELCKYEFKSGTKNLDFFGILKKVQSSNLTLSILINIPVIVFLLYKCNSMLRHLFSFVFSHMLGNYGRREESKKIFAVLKAVLAVLVRLVPIMIAGSILPLFINSTAKLAKKLCLEFKRVQFEEVV